MSASVLQPVPPGEGEEALLRARRSRELAFLARGLIYCTLPHSDPGDVPCWSRRHGSRRLVLVRTLPHLLGYPYGTVPRLLLYWMTTEALRTRSRHLTLGETLSDFLRTLGLDPRSGGGRRGAPARVKTQLRRLLATSITLHDADCEAYPTHEEIRQIPIASRARLSWTPQSLLATDGLPPSTLELGEGFYQTLLERPVPLDLGALRRLRKSPFQLDLYAWSSHMRFLATHRDRPEDTPWLVLRRQLGSGYASPADFRKRALRALARVRQASPGLRYERVRGGVRIWPGGG